VSAGAAGDSFVSHLLELRSRLLKSVLAVLLCFCALLPFSNELYTRLVQPLIAVLPSGGHVVAIDVATGFTVPMRLAFFAALMLATPLVLYQLWAFVAPGLYRHEKRLARPLLVAATVLFYGGCAFAYFLMLPMMFAYFAATTPTGVTWTPDMSNILDFVMVILLGGGVAFVVPVAVMFAVILGWVKPAQLSAWRGYVIVAIFIIAAIITPPDGLTQIMLALPMCALYELGLVFARMLARERPATSP
jgi:sec-independent protein translocase protein TatC